MEYGNAKQHRSHGSDACPYGVGRADGQCMHGLSQQTHAEKRTYHESHSPKIKLYAGNAFHFPETESESGLKKSGNNQDNPVHKANVYFKDSSSKRGEVSTFPQYSALHLIRKHFLRIFGTISYLYHSAMNLHDIINNICPLPHPAMEKLSECSFQTECPKGFHILKAGKVETNIYFIARGIGRAYITSEDKDITFWIGQEGDTLMSLKSYVKGEPGYENVELMEDSLLYGFRRDDLLRLYRKDIHIANWGRKLAEQEFLRTEKKLIPLLFTTASMRYHTLLKDNPALLQRIPLECLASYLGITPVSLSRIRASLKKDSK